MSYIPINDSVRIPMIELRIHFARSGGPGGVVNRLDTKVEVRWSPSKSEALNDADREWVIGQLKDRLSGEGDLVVVSSKSREQAKNRSEAIATLAQTVRDALVRPKGAKLPKKAAAAPKKAAKSATAKAKKPAKKRARG
jgi:ribosome-associated protein